MKKNSTLNLPKYDLGERTALITGGAGLLGVEHAKAILEVNGRVVLSDINEVTLEAAVERLTHDFSASRIISIVLDVTDEKSIIEAAEKFSVQNIEIDILINNVASNPKYSRAGRNQEFSRLENFRLEDWNLEISVGLTSAFLCSKIFGVEMAIRNRGVILNIASDLSVIAPDQRLYKIESLIPELQPVKPVTYSVIKAGLVGLTKYLATYWNESGVRVNSLSPGGVYEDQPAEFLESISKLIPMGRMANKDEYQSAVQFLCSDASSYMTGQNIVIDGGRSIW